MIQTIEQFIDLISPWSTLFAVFLGIIFWFHAKGYIEKEMPRSPENHCRAAAIFAAIGIILAVLAHEFAHASVAILFGIKVNSIGLLPLGGYTSFETPISKISPLHAIAISMAGPLINLLIGGLALIPVKLASESVPENTVQYLAFMNIKLGVWNIIPIFIFLDGGWAVQAIGRYLFGESSIYTLIFTIIITTIALNRWWHYHKRFENRLEKILKTL